MQPIVWYHTHETYRIHITPLLGSVQEAKMQLQVLFNHSSAVLP